MKCLLHHYILSIGYPGSLVWSDDDVSLEDRQISNGIIDYLSLFDHSPVCCGHNVGIGTLGPPLNKPKISDDDTIADLRSIQWIQTKGSGYELANKISLKMLESSTACNDSLEFENMGPIFIQRPSNTPSLTLQMLTDRISQGLDHLQSKVEQLGHGTRISVLIFDTIIAPTTELSGNLRSLLKLGVDIDLLIFCLNESVEDISSSDSQDVEVKSKKLINLERSVLTLQRTLQRQLMQHGDLYEKADSKQFEGSLLIECIPNAPESWEHLAQLWLSRRTKHLPATLRLLSNNSILRNTTVARVSVVPFLQSMSIDRVFQSYSVPQRTQTKETQFDLAKGRASSALSQKVPQKYSPYVPTVATEPSDKLAIQILHWMRHSDVSQSYLRSCSFLIHKESIGEVRAGSSATIKDDEDDEGVVIPGKRRLKQLTGATEESPSDSSSAVIVPALWDSLRLTAVRERLVLMVMVQRLCPQKRTENGIPIKGNDEGNSNEMESFHAVLAFSSDDDSMNSATLVPLLSRQEALQLPIALSDTQFLRKALGRGASPNEAPNSELDVNSSTVVRLERPRARDPSDDLESSEIDPVLLALVQGSLSLKQFYIPGPLSLSTRVHMRNWKLISEKEKLEKVVENIKTKERDKSREKPKDSTIAAPNQRSIQLPNPSSSQKLNHKSSQKDRSVQFSSLLDDIIDGTQVRATEPTKRPFKAPPPPPAPQPPQRTTEVRLAGAENMRSPNGKPNSPSITNSTRKFSAPLRPRQPNEPPGPPKIIRDAGAPAKDSPFQRPLMQGQSVNGPPKFTDPFALVENEFEAPGLYADEFDDESYIPVYSSVNDVSIMQSFNPVNTSVPPNSKRRSFFG